MRSLRVVGLFLATSLLLSFAQARAAKPQPNALKKTAEPIVTLALDGPDPRRQLLDVGQHGLQ